MTTEHLCKQNGYLGTTNCPQCLREENEALRDEISGDNLPMFDQIKILEGQVSTWMDRAEKAEHENERLREKLDKVRAVIVRQHDPGLLAETEEVLAPKEDNNGL